MERLALPTLRQLAYLVELSARLNFRVAAEAQNVTQSTLSAGIKQLETLLGVQLVERDNRNITRTRDNEMPCPGLQHEPQWTHGDRRTGRDRAKILFHQCFCLRLVYVADDCQAGVVRRVVCFEKLPYVL